METLAALRAGQLKGIKRLDLAAGLSDFPLEILELADSLEVLNLTHNQLKSLPDEFGCLQKLKIAFFSDNEFKEFPAVLSQCPHLSMIGFKSNQITTIAETAFPKSVRWLILTDNQIEQVPVSIGQLVALQKLMLAGNHVRSLPEEMAACQNLELIRLSANRLTRLPDWLFTLPRLSWLAYSGNPLCEPTAISSPGLAEIDWATLAIEGTLGEGASGVIFKGSWAQDQTQRVDVAVKVFKGRVTSDGLPLDEMKLWMAAGSHPHLVTLIGKLNHHPEQKAGLVFAFVPSTYKALGLPPSLDSCTRDTYPLSSTFSVPVILQIAQGIAAAAAHLHANGILHGDLYAHNILVNPTGESLLGDFGAASLYPSRCPSMARSLEWIEVRAFGCLLEDLLDRCVLDDSLALIERRDRLRCLQQDCMQLVPSERPSFTKICQVLATMA